MRIRSLTTKSLLAGAALAIGIPTVAMAAHPFEDVPDGEWFSDAVEWAYDNNLTTGKTPTTFNGWDTMNRYEGVTFINRYHTEIVVPLVEAADAKADAAHEKLEALEADLAEKIAMQFDMFDHDIQSGSLSTSDIEGVSVPTTATVTIPDGYKGHIVVEFSAESACSAGIGVLDWCEIDLFVDGNEISQLNQAFDSTDSATETVQSWEGHTVRAITGELDAGTYTVTVEADVSTAATVFDLDDGVLTAEVQLSDDDTLDFVAVQP